MITASHNPTFVLGNILIRPFRKMPLINPSSYNPTQKANTKLESTTNNQSLFTTLGPSIYVLIAVIKENNK